MTGPGRRSGPASSDEVALARELLAATERAGQDMAREHSWPDLDEGDTWTLEGLEPQQREGLVRAARILLGSGRIEFRP